MDGCAHDCCSSSNQSVNGFEGTVKVKGSSGSLTNPGGFKEVGLFQTMQSTGSKI